MARRSKHDENVENSLHWENISKKLLIWTIVVFLFGCLFFGLMFGVAGGNIHQIFKDTTAIVFFCIFAVSTTISIALLIIKIRIHKYLKTDDYERLALIPRKISKGLVGIGIVIAIGALVGAICVFKMLEDGIEKYAGGIFLCVLCGLNIFLAIYYGIQSRR